MSDPRPAPRPDQADTVDPRQRRPYQPPVLTEYGPVQKLTQNNTGSFADGMGNMMMGSCL